MKQFILVALFVMVVPLNVWATSVSVCNAGNGCTYTTIASALAGVGNGNHIITVKAPYTGNERVNISTSGTGVGTEMTIKADTGYTPVTKGFTVTGNYVIVNGFEMTACTTGTCFYNNGNYVTALNNYIHGDTAGTKWEVEIAYNASPVKNNFTFSGNRVTSSVVNRGSDYPFIFGVCNNCTFSNNELGPGIDVDVFRIWGNTNYINGNYIHGFTQAGTTGACQSAGSHMDIIQIFGDCGSAWCHTMSNLHFYNNFVTDSACQMFNLSKDNQAGISGVYLYDNLFVGFRLQGNTGIPDIRITNNTFIDCGDSNKMAINIINDGGGFDSTGLAIQNNIIVQTWDQQPFNQSAPGLTHSNNYTAYRVGATYNRIAGWSETGGINGGDPKFVRYSGNNSSASNDFSLQLSSPLLGKGLVIPGLTTDRQGILRANPPSIGAYEYGNIQGIQSPKNLRIVN